VVRKNFTAKTQRARSKKKKLSTHGIFAVKKKRLDRQDAKSAKEKKKLSTHGAFAVRSIEPRRRKER
jgi:hypothetical protein